MAAAAAAPAGVRDVDAREHEITDEQRRVVEESWEKMQRTLSTTRQRCHWDRKMVRRYLRAHKWNAAKALEGMKATEAWRSEFDVDGIVLKKWQTLRVQSDSGKVYCKGTDRDGHPLIFMHPVRENLWDHHGDLINLVATLERAISEMGPGVEKWCVCIDFIGYTSRNAPAFRTSRATLEIFMYHYPERLHRAYCVNPPIAFWIFWKLITPFIDPVTYAKILLVRGEEEAKKKVLLADISEDMLVVQFPGGRRVVDFESEAVREEYWTKESALRASFAAVLEGSLRSRALRRDELRREWLDVVATFL